MLDFSGASSLQGVCRDNAWQRIFCGLGIMLRPLELKFQVWSNFNFKFG